ncbi:hypothetical protein ACFYUV_38160 [Nonomuraea sp. NPDC003560]|uniref:hypothetical protein n=1 Tax=Nonomuraea sp. NPDC003560 TaxID=3364341 RepID=UPI003676B97E
MAATPAQRLQAATAASRGLDLDRWDGICAAGVLCLFAGAWIWVGLGVALAVVGVLLLGLGITGARQAAGPSTGEGS